MPFILPFLYHEVDGPIVCECVLRHNGWWCPIHEDQGTFATEMLEKLDDGTQQEVAQCSFFFVCIWIMEFIVLWWSDEQNQATIFFHHEALFAVVSYPPHHLLKASPIDMGEQQVNVILCAHRRRWQNVEESRVKWGTAAWNHRKLGTNTGFSQDGSLWMLTFHTWWKFTAGLLATVFPNTAVVELGFPFMNEKKSFRSSLLDLTLERIMHSKQYQALF